MSDDGERFEITPHLTAAKPDDLARSTYLGQAHFAGTGPAGKTCRECRFWHGWRGRGDDRKPGHSYFPAKHPTTPLVLKRQMCRYPIMNKARRGFPHHALSCSLFQASENPPPKRKPSDDDLPE